MPTAKNLFQILNLHPKKHVLKEIFTKDFMKTIASNKIIFVYLAYEGTFHFEIVQQNETVSRVREKIINEWPERQALPYLTYTETC